MWGDRCSRGAVGRLGGGWWLRILPLWHILPFLRSCGLLFLSIIRWREVADIPCELECDGHWRSLRNCLLNKCPAEYNDLRYRVLWGGEGLMDPVKSRGIMEESILLYYLFWDWEGQWKKQWFNFIGIMKIWCVIPVPWSNKLPCKLWVPSGYIT